MERSVKKKYEKIYCTLKKFFCWNAKNGKNAHFFRYLVHFLNGFHVRFSTFFTQKKHRQLTEAVGLRQTIYYLRTRNVIDFFDNFFDINHKKNDDH